MNDISKMLDEHLKKRHSVQRKQLHQKKREELYRLEKEDLPKDAIIIPRKNVKSFLFGAVSIMLVIAIIGGVYGAVTIGQQISSTVTTGTAPFSISSTTKVTNLNADLLDDLSSADLQDKPTAWTCAIRAGSLAIGTSTASCTGNEKVISGGCSGNSGDYNTLATSRPTGQGWTCHWGSSTSGTAYANCCA